MTVEESCNRVNEVYGSGYSNPGEVLSSLGAPEVEREEALLLIIHLLGQDQDACKLHPRHSQRSR